MVSSCLHVKIKATRQDLQDMGVCSDATFDMLLSGQAFPVNRKVRQNGRNLVFLDHPTDPARDLYLWVYEEFTEPIHV